MRLIILFLIFVSHSIQANPTRIIAVSEPPANFVNMEGQVDGYVTQIVQAIQKRLNDSTQIEFMPEMRALYTAESEANIVLFSFSRTVQRENDYYWILPVLRKSWLVYVKSESTLKFETIDDLRHISGVGVVRGDVRESWLKDQGFSNLQAVSGHSQNIKRLMSNRLPAIMSEKLEMHYLAHELGIDTAELRCALEVNRSDVYIIMSKNSDIQLVKQWQDAARQLSAEGVIEKIALDWRKRIHVSENVETTVEDGILIF